MSFAEPMPILSVCLCCEELAAESELQSSKINISACRIRGSLAKQRVCHND